MPATPAALSTPVTMRARRAGCGRRRRRAAGVVLAVSVMRRASGRNLRSPLETALPGPGIRRCSPRGPVNPIGRRVAAEVTGQASGCLRPALLVDDQTFRPGPAQDV